MEGTAKIFCSLYRPTLFTRGEPRKDARATCSKICASVCLVPQGKGKKFVPWGFRDTEKQRRQSCDAETETQIMQENRNAKAVKKTEEQKVSLLKIENESKMPLTNTQRKLMKDTPAPKNSRQREKLVSRTAAALTGTFAVACVDGEWTDDEAYTAGRVQTPQAQARPPGDQLSFIPEPDPKYAHSNRSILSGFALSSQVSSCPLFAVPIRSDTLCLDSRDVCVCVCVCVCVIPRQCSPLHQTAANPSGCFEVIPQEWDAGIKRCWSIPVFSHGKLLNVGVRISMSVSNPGSALQLCTSGILQRDWLIEAEASASRLGRRWIGSDGASGGGERREPRGGGELCGGG